MQPAFALNHMSVARLSYADLLTVASDLGCVGVEVRNDLPEPLFDGIPAQQAGAMARDKGLRLLALAEVKRFNDWTADTAAETLDLIRTAKAAGAEAISLIPRNDNGGLNEGERQANLRVALREALPMLRDHDMRALVEPLGFASCALRSKQEAVDAITGLDAGDTYRLIHDTFHHHLAPGATVFPAHTGMIHISGVVEPSVATDQMTDAHRGLVDDRDRLENIKQINELALGNCHAPLSFEAFAPDVHALSLIHISEPTRPY